ncbi:hypothetical protein SteCoe_23762 [Stentor coeruleus]|uniref:Protein kinase domain-containing protein n=1 Tax=Stentor coeruleus TaxID=5963 RepID=A0A1R2BJ65_9CILI|nr:hypothetical protein SteCoe_23762 [Stentor coeruleus]
MVFYERLQDFIDAMLLKIEERNQWNSEMINNLLKQQYYLNLVTLKEYYDEVKLLNIVDEVYKTIISLCLFQLLNRSFISYAYHDLIVECLVMLAQEENCNVKALKDKLVLKSLENTDYEDETRVAEFWVILREYALIYKISKALEKFNIKMTLELRYISSSAEIYIMKLLTDHTKIPDIINKIRLAKKNHMMLVNLQTITGMFIEEYCKVRKIQEKSKELIDLMDNENIEGEKYQEYEPSIKNNTPEIGKYIRKEQVEDDFGVITKLETKYMNTQGMVSVSIFECHRQGYPDKVALKECKTKFKEYLSGYYEEAKILKTLSGKSVNFLKFFGANQKVEDVLGVKTHIFQIQMEYVERTLKDDKENRLAQNLAYTEIEFESIFYQLVSALNILRTLNIIHCDIKPTNILITNEGVLKIIDFNAATSLKSTTIIGNYAGTMSFMAPEILKGLEKGDATIKQDKPDVFSLGMTLLFLLIKEPINGLNAIGNENKLLEAIKSVPYMSAVNILTKMLEHNPEKRPGMNNLLGYYSNNSEATIAI